MTPIIIAKEKPFSIAPPKMYIENNASKVVTEVIKVRDKVSFVEVFEISAIGIFEYFLKRLKSVTTYVGYYN